jgi:glycerophosphoryl diester phosphodiesterase
VLGHRGASAHAVDNTLRSYQLALEMGADGIEFDVRLSADDVAVLHHDPEVDGFGVLRDHSFEEIRARLPWVPTLDELLTVTGDMLLNVEIKNHPGQPDYDRSDRAVEVVAEWIRANAVADRVVVSSFNPTTVDRMHDHLAEVATGQLLDRRVRLLDQLAPIAERGHSWVVPHESSLGRDAATVVSAAHDAGLSVAVWTVDGTRKLQALAAAGVDAVITNRPRKALELYD